MDKLNTFQSNSPKGLFTLAKRLNESKFFQLFLSEPQSKIINYILNLDNLEIWANFLEGNCYISYLESENSKEKTLNDKELEQPSETDNQGSKDEKTDLGNEPEEPETLFEQGISMSKMLAFHIRYLLWEKAVDFYYSSKELSESDKNLEEVTDDYELIDSLDSLSDDEEQQKAGKRQEKIEKPVIRAIEDDYDDDYDEEEEPAKPEVVEVEKPKKSSLEYNSENQLVLEIPKSVLIPTSKSESTTNNMEQVASSQKLENGEEVTSREDQEKIIKEFNKVYHNFEYDRETLLKRRKLEQSDLQLAHSKETPTDKKQNESKHVEINLGAASTSLQHLLSRIQMKRDEISLNDHDLRNLFMDVRKNRGKWANDDRIGQEELYEACEKVVVELRGYTEHSTPFLNKVSKREAPNYGLIIKKPMDLNTVMKKLKNLSYNSKQEFVDDLMLIWNNCLTYNADPKHFIRAHAIAMQKKTAKLVPTIPDITIRSRAEVEKEEENDVEKKDERHTGGKAMKKGRKRTRLDEIKTEVEVPGTATPSAAGTPISIDSYDNGAGSETPMPENGDMENDEEEEEEEENDNMNGGNGNISEEEEEFDPELQAWRLLTAKSRANYCAQRAELFDDNYHLRPDAKAIIRQSNEMANFNQYLTNKEVVSKSSNLLENDEPYLLEYDIMGGVPGFKYKGVDKEEEDKQEEYLVDQFLRQSNGDASKIKSDFVLPVDTGLNQIYRENIGYMQEIRKICFKISLIRQMQTQQFVHHTQMKQPEIDALKEVDLDPISKLSNHDPFNKEVQYSVLRRNIGKIAMQTGFEATEPFAINTLTQVAEKYLGNLIKSIKLHTESNSENKLTTREILLLSLLENGVDKPDDLHTFIQERVMKQQDKLKDLRVKLSNFLKDLLRPGLENFNEKSFDDNSEQFMTGDFSNDLGDDFFGFKELGLDKEFNMLSSSIPIYLLHSRLHNQFSSTGGPNKRNKYEDLKEFEPARLTASDVSSQIGILIPFYTKLSEKSKAHFVKMQKKKNEPTDLPEDNLLILIEDEELPQKQRNVRPRLPPTGKITSIKKKIIANSFFLPEETDSQQQPANANMSTDEDLSTTVGSPKKSEEPNTFSTSPLKSEIKSEA